MKRGTKHSDRLTDSLISFKNCHGRFLHTPRKEIRVYYQKKYRHAYFHDRRFNELEKNQIFYKESSFNED
jgi:hypothetical protein